MILSVYKVNLYIKTLLEHDALLENFLVEGEISNLKVHSSGHVYFSLKDDYATISCVMFKSFASGLPFSPENGMRVIAFCRAGLYEKTGQLQLYAEALEPSGKGALFLAFEQLKAKLEAEGLFEQSHKRPIPDSPGCIAVITSSTGAVVRDIINVARRRNKSQRLVVVPVLVQGEQAPQDIIRGLNLVNSWGKADVAIIARGGGSIEELWAFNDESLARAVYNSRTPVISAVGHQTDFTILDFVADLRAATPSEAAELAVPNTAELREYIKSLTAQCYSAMRTKSLAYRSRLLDYHEIFKSVTESIYQRQIYISDKVDLLKKNLEQQVRLNRLRLSGQAARLQALSPLNVLSRGYALVYKNGEAVPTINNINENETLTVALRDGQFSARVTEVDDACQKNPLNKI